MSTRLCILCLGLGLAAQAAFPQAAPPAGQQGMVSHQDDHHPDPLRPYYCRVENLPTSWAFDSAPPAAIGQHEVNFVETGHTLASFRFRNIGSLRLGAVALIVEYLDDQGQTIDEIPVAGVSKMAAHSFDVPFPVEPTWVYLKGVQEGEQWESAVPPGGSVLLAGSKDGIRTGDCPAAAKVTFLRLQFTDGTARTFSSRGWHLDPIPRRIPEVPTTFRPLSVIRPLSLLARVKISASGEVVDVVPDDPNNPPEVLRWIREFMRQEWRFHPALLAGTPVDSQLTVLFRFPADATQAFPEIEPMLSPVTLIQFFRKHDLYPNNYTGSDLVVMYGQSEEGSVVE